MYKKLLSPILLLIFGSSIFFLSCKKDIKNDPSPDPGTAFAIPAATPVTGSVSGLVVDENNIPVNGAAVNYGAAVINTDAKGMFSFNHVTLDKYITTVTVTRTGYFKAIRSFSANASRNFVSIKLLPKALSGTVSSNTAGSVSLPNNTEISFQANTIVVKATGNPYTGTVNVFASYIDPTGPDISSVVPGSFLGRDANNLYSLQSAGMIAVDLESSTGEPLQLATGTTANIKLRIPASLLSKAPATIDTWSLNDQGVWQKEGTAIRDGDYYQMKVTHFSFWNCDVPTNAIYLTLHIQDQAGNALPNMLISLTASGGTLQPTTYGLTDSLGNVSGLVPAEQVLTLNAYPNIYNCNSPLNTQEIGPFSANTTLTITASLAASQILTVSGTATDCNGQPVQTGTAIIYADMYGFTYVPVVNGSYSAGITHCSSVNAVSVTVIDDNGVQASSSNVTVSGNTVSVPVINVCGGGQDAVFVFGGPVPQGDCIVTASTGTYMVGTALTANNLIGVTVVVSSPGNYHVTTSLVNGFSFTGSGVFTTTGVQTLFLTGSGMPVSTGAFTYQTMSGTTAGCVFSIFTQALPQPQAVYDMGGPGACNGTTIAGTYNAGSPVSAGNTVSFNINVISTGTYSISTGNPINGLQFSDSGTFVTTGPRIVLLQAEGVPTNSSTYTYTPMASNGTVGCTFAITPTNNGPAAAFTLAGAPGSCSGAVLNGTYVSGIALDATNTVSLVVNVTSVGAFTIQTGTVNGISFSGTGVFTGVGTQLVTLQGTGVPVQAGSNTFTPSSTGGGTACSFSLSVN